MTERDGRELSDVIRYAVNSEKTQQAENEDCTVVHRFVSGINCSPATARDEMLAVKKRFGKENGTVAYHGYQSFAPGEVTPETAHEIGMKLAARLWGDRYQVIVATHLDKENHLHNHFVLNTVSFVDGIKYHRTKKDYHDMQTVSDELCREVATIKAAAKATVAAVKAIIAGTKALISAIAAGGWVAVVIIIVVCLIALIVGSCFGIFFSGEDSGSSMTMQSVVQEINTDYQTQLDTTKTNISYDVLEMSGSRAVWPEVLAVYAVKTTTDPNNPQDVATMDASKKAILKDIFWQMNTISSRTETKTEEIITETDDGHGNIVETKTTVTRTYLYISVAHKTAGEMADKFGFNADQRKQLAELLAEENRSMWSAVLYGIYTEDGQIVSVALSQIGNVGGQPYWSWYGFDSRVEWCACFVSWAANECGYIDSGIIPKFAGCTNGVQWFKDRGQWIDNSATPSPGMIIFFDWNNKGSSGPQDGLSDHVGIVERVEDGIIYTIEGNSGDSCRENHYAVGHYEFLGYGVPAY